MKRWIEPSAFILAIALLQCAQPEADKRSAPTPATQVQEPAPLVVEDKGDGKEACFKEKHRQAAANGTPIDNYKFAEECGFFAIENADRDSYLACKKAKLLFDKNTKTCSNIPTDESGCTIEELRARYADVFANYDQIITQRIEEGYVPDQCATTQAIPNIILVRPSTETNGYDYIYIP